MTKEEIIELAREAGFDTYESYCLSGESELDMTLAVEEYPIGKTVFKFAELVAAKERERCAMVCEETDNDPHVVLHVGIVCAEAIRSRNENRQQALPVATRHDS